jgi:hypothetical protein
VRTLVATPDPPPRRPVDGYTFSVGSPTTSTLDAVFAFVHAAGVTVTPWQAVVIREAYASRAPYRTTAIVERRRAIERA